MDLEKIKKEAARLAQSLKGEDGPIVGLYLTDAQDASDAFGEAVKEVERLQAFERGEVVPGVVVSANLAASQRWIEEAEAPLRAEIERLRIESEAEILVIGRERDRMRAERDLARTEIGRLRALAIEGWERARSQAEAADDEESEGYAAMTLDGLGAPRPNNSKIEATS